MIPAMDVKSTTTLVLGDIMSDRYVTGHVRRISPEAPIPVLRHEGTRATLGGAGNVAANVAGLGGHAILIGVVGDDAAGREALSACADPRGSITLRAITVPGRATTVKTRFMSAAHQLLRLDEEDTSKLSPAIEAAILAEFERNMVPFEVTLPAPKTRGRSVSL